VGVNSPLEETVSSPIAQSLIGKTKGVTVEVMAPGGVKINWDMQAARKCDSANQR
jgi:transcription elongation GreA/GreB family factor